MKILFMGTPDIAAHSLEALCGTNHTICGAFTREDKPVGRKQILTAPPVKQVALTHDIPVFQPKTLRDGTSEQIIRDLAPDLIVVVAYGRILPPEILALPKYGCINLHVSLLPKYRGAAPVQWAVLNGDKETGVTIMQLDEGLDTGDILMVSPVQIGEEETSGELFDRITAEGAETLLKCIEKIAAGEVQPQPQDHEKATLAPPLTKEMAKLDFIESAEVLHNRVRGMNPWPMAWFDCEGKRVKLTECRVALGHGKPGEILQMDPLTVACGEGALTLLQVVPEGKKPMTGTAWVLGRRLTAGESIV
ncbi:MAG: methionyl-tRNA formyltransferase [Oscillospiraceae bacterium]|nr:methionyl-tRNA formyltransferase [Oscillospiraceae bacterium]